MSETTKKLKHLRLNDEDIHEYEIEAEELFGDTKKSNVLIIADIKRGAKARREQRLGKQESHKVSDIMDVFEGL